MYNNFDELFKWTSKQTAKMSMFQTDCFLHGVYNEYKHLIKYDEDTFFALHYYKDAKFAESEHMRLKLDNEFILEKYNKATLYGKLPDGRRYYNYFKRSNDGIWYFSYYKEDG